MVRQAQAASFCSASATSLRRPDDPRLAGNAAVVLDAAMTAEVKNGLLAEFRCVEIAIGNDQLIVFASGLPIILPPIMW
jgi:hypothetical protein